MNGGTAYWAFFLGLNPLKKALVVKEVSTSAKPATVEQLGHADDAYLVGSSGGWFKYSVEMLD